MGVGRAGGGAGRGQWWGGAGPGRGQRWGRRGSPGEAGPGQGRAGPAVGGQGGAEGGLPVHADGTQVEDGGSAQHDVHGHERVTEPWAQHPHATLDLGREEGAMQQQETQDPLTSLASLGQQPGARPPGLLLLE